MLSLVSCLAFVNAIFITFSERMIVGGKTQFLFDAEKGSTSTLSQNYRLSNQKPKQPLSRFTQHLQDFQFGGDSGKDAIHIVDPPALTKKDKLPRFTSQQERTKPHQEHSSNVGNAIIWKHMPTQLIQNHPPSNHRPSFAFLIKPKLPNENALLAPHPETPKHNHQLNKQNPKKHPVKHVMGFGSVYRPEHFNLHSAMTQLPQFYPFQVTAAVRHKKIIRTSPASLALHPNTKERVRTKKLKTFQSKMVHDISDFQEQADDTQLDILHTNVTSQIRTRREANTNSHKKTTKLMRGSLLPIALTIMGENGELLTGRALLQHITVLLKNTSTFEPSDESEDSNKFPNGDVLLNEKDFHRIMENSMNLTDPVMLTVLGLNALNDSSLLTNTYVNEYLNCIDASKITNKFQALQTKIDCMKHKLFDNSNFDSTGSSRYSISNLPAALVYADVMSNIKNLVRPKKGIAFYSLPVDELTHLQQVVLPIDEYVPQVHSSHFAPRSYHNRKFIFNENVHPSRMPVLYLVKPDGRIYQTEGGRNPHPPTIFHGFPDIPNADVFVEGGPPHGSIFESMYYDD